MDAGFLTAMHIKPKFLKDFLSIVFTAFYLIYADKADEKVRKYRAVATFHMMRISWEKSDNPYLRMLTVFDRGSPTSFPDDQLNDIKARIYFHGSKEELVTASKLIFHVPGGGFVTMSPRCHDDYVSNWARKTKVPIISINYGKAPEHPYPCYDAYRAIVESNGKVIGFQGWVGKDGKKVSPLKIIVTGDSAGGNLATGLTLRTLEPTSVLPATPCPAGLLLIYPCLSLEISCWMPQEQMHMIRAESVKSMTNIKSLLQAKDHFITNEEDSPLAVPEAPKKIDVLTDKVDRDDTGITGWMKRRRASKMKEKNFEPCHSTPIIRSSLSMTSRMSYFQDRILAPEMMRAMALLYLNGSPIPYNIQEDIYLSPINTPNDILERFPQTFFITGEKDPFVDDTVVFAAKLRQAKERKKNRIKGGFGIKRVEQKQKKSKKTLEEFGVRVKILEGISHAFFNMMAFLPETRQAITLTSEWFLEMLGVNVENEEEFTSSSFNGHLSEELLYNSSDDGFDESIDMERELSIVKEKKLMQRRREQLSEQHLQEGNSDFF
ncbi:hypothetical protein HK099_002307 [Clydaea vesicula]|uniref:Alpha/beta hydrolase fold-3 domain-containing protein n=1 Tax=Clydaea vesicula TaxID=447962 RepID=A0AAD5Y1G2_9FUNG|nr:hypothetical protein HK099_002307 [Clydaea vesicula]